MSAPQAILDSLANLASYLQSGTANKPVPPQPADTLTPPFGVTMTLCTIFALDWDGKTFDTGDNGKGAWGANTRDPSIVGVALPIVLVEKTFGNTEVSTLAGCQVQVYSQITQKEVMADIVDLGPSAWTHRLLDGTWGLHKALGHIDYGIATYGPNYSKWPAGFHCAYWINDANGKTMEIKGVDFSAGKIIGS